MIIYGLLHPVCTCPDSYIYPTETSNMINVLFHIQWYLISQGGNYRYANFRDDSFAYINHLYHGFALHRSNFRDTLSLRYRPFHFPLNGPAVVELYSLLT